MTALVNTPMSPCAEPKVNAAHTRGSLVELYPIGGVRTFAQRPPAAHKKGSLSAASCGVYSRPRDVVETASGSQQHGRYSEQTRLGPCACGLGFYLTFSLIRADRPERSRK